jgi:hypothetical protein
MSDRKHYKTVLCKDGLYLSVQANSRAYSSPQNDTGPYTHVEVGFPTRPVPELIPYAEIPEDEYTRTVYPYVPYDLVRQVIYVRGGIAEGELPPPAKEASKIKL